MITSSGRRRSMDVWWTHMSGARWFAGKGRDGVLTRIQALPWYSDQGVFPAVRSELATVSYPNGESETYHLLACYRPAESPTSIGALDAAEVGLGEGSVWLQEGAADPEAIRVLLARQLAGASSQDDSSGWAFHTPRPDGLDADLPPRLFGGEQSNTSVMLGDAAMLKLFRKLEPGRNLDIEVHDALGRQGSHDVAILFGWLSATLHSAGGSSTSDLGMVVEQLRDAQDGWRLALESAAAGGDFTAQARELGSALVDIHRALATALPVTELSGDELAETMRARLNVALGAAPALAPHEAGLIRIFDALHGRRLQGQRIHGDFHLGQTLLTDAGWRIIDFEGEPMKTMAERMAPDAVWRDVAGMLRSFSYATSGHADPQGPEANSWLAGVRQAFLTGYGGLISPQDAALLMAYEADKAIYEVVYETRNRPDWVSIPLQAVARYAASTDNPKWMIGGAGDDAATTQGAMSAGTEF